MGFAPFPVIVQPMLPTLVKLPFSNPDWLFERNGSAKIPRLHEFYLQPKHSGWYLSKPHSSSHPGSLPWNPELIRDFFHKEI
jgi:hypothetical protein